MTVPGHLAFATGTTLGSLPKALVLRDSVLRFHPGATFRIAVADPWADPAAPTAGVVGLSAFGVADRRWWVFQRTPDEAPRDLAWLLLEALTAAGVSVYLDHHLYARAELATLTNAPPEFDAQGRLLFARYDPSMTEAPRAAEVRAPALLAGTFADARTFDREQPAVLVDMRWWDARQPLAPKPPPAFEASHEACRVARRYQRALLDAGYAESAATDAPARCFENGVPIPPVAREIARSLDPDARARFGSPYLTGPGSFYEWLTSTGSGTDTAGVSRLWKAVHASRPDVQAAHPDLAATRCKDFLGWAVGHGRLEHGIDPRMGPAPRRAAVDQPQGVNMVGLTGSDTGQGSAARALAAAAGGVGLRVASVTVEHPYDDQRPSRARQNADDNPYSVNVFVASGDAFGSLRSHLGERFFAGRRSVAYWMWETNRIPSSWVAWFAEHDEVWAPSRYAAEAITASTGREVVVIPHAIERHPGTARTLTREDLMLPRDATVFAFAFDHLSSIERKNPLGVIEAFRRAFGPDPRAALLIKTSRARFDPEGRARLHDAAEALRNVRVLDATFAAPGVIYDLSDCYVSLHRSEGFGLTIAEAMAAGKPVIATAHGGNVDFMAPDAAFMIPFELRELSRDFGAYPRGDLWAEPDLDAAATAMRTVFEDQDEARTRARKGQALVLRHTDPARVGAMVRDRVEALSRTS